MRLAFLEEDVLERGPLLSRDLTVSRAGRMRSCDDISKFVSQLDHMRGLTGPAILMSSGLKKLLAILAVAVVALGVYLYEQHS